MKRIEYGQRRASQSKKAVLTAVVLGALLMAGCGSDDVTAAVTESRSGGEAEAVAPEDAAADPIAWGDEIISAWGAYGETRGELAGSYISGRIGGETEVALAATLFEGEAQALTSLLGALPSAPADAALATVYEKFVSALEADQLKVAGWSGTLAADGETLQAEFDQGPESSAYVGIREARADSENAVVLLCFDIQTAIADAGGGVLDCVDSDDSDGPPANEAAVDPTVEATGFVNMPDVAPGTYEFSVFDRSLTLTFERPVVIGTAADAIEISLEGDDVFFVATDRVADPTDLVPNCCAGEIPLPDDLATWIDQLPVKVVDEGTWDVGGVESTWSDLQFDFDAGYEGDPFVGLVGFSDGFGMPIFPEATVRLSRVAHPDGPMLIGVYAVDRPMAEIAPIAEQIVASATFSK